jgi:hypothetical protein
MKRFIKALILAVMLMTLMSPIAIYAADLDSPATIVSDLDSEPDSLEGINFEAVDNTFYAAGRHWIIYVNDDGDIVYESSTYGYTWIGDDIATSTIYGVEVACFFDGTYIHYARYQPANGQPSATKYRMGTPGSDGTITWAAVEQTVNTTPGELAAMRVAISVDEEGYPWVGWVDTDGTNTFGQMFVESSSTKDGTWTEDVTQTFGAGGIAADGTGTMTGSPVYLDIGANTPTVTVEGTFTITLPIGGTGTATTGGWTITDSPVSLVAGANVITVEAGGAGTITIDLDLERNIWFPSLTPVDDDKQIQVAYSEEDTSGGETDGQMDLQACLYDDDTGWDAIEEVVASGGLYETRPDAFDFYDHGSAMWVVYTDDDGYVVAGARSQIESWAEGHFGFIKEIPGTPYYPTISGYRVTAGGGGEDLICIVNSAVSMDYAIHIGNGDVDDWSSWQLIWVVPDISNDVISRHVATYKYRSPLGFAWQYNDFSEGTDTIHYWWIESTNDTLGWYSSPAADAAEPLNNIIPLIFVIFCLVLLVILMSRMEMNVQTLIIAAVLIYIMIAFLQGIQGIIDAF